MSRAVFGNLAEIDVSNPQQPILKGGLILNEVYAGHIDLLVDNIGGNIFHGDYKSFLPLFGTNVRFYDEGTILVSALLVTPLGFDKNIPDQGFISIVDDFELKLERQAFLGIQGTPLCLVLHYTLGLFNGKIRRVGYHVTLQTPGLKLEDHEIGRSEKPA